MAVPQTQTGSPLRGAGMVQMEDREAPQNIKMAIYTRGQLIPSLGDEKFRKPVITEIIEKKFKNYTKDILDMHGIFYGTTSAMSGVLANAIFRSSFKVQHEALKSFATLATLPFLSTVITYKLFITDALHSGNISRENCVLRSILIGFICGVSYPSGLAFSKNGHLAVKYHTVPLPPKGRVILYWLTLSQTGMKAMVVPLVFQAVFGLLHSSHHYAVCERMRAKAGPED
ncbi:complex I assembly factor TMEM126B, mitochondrial [Peromyscus californicus insignis]|uniref:complex I assembly factor TMEM126B, mitochondrial n=1 Tax=Peromyscus californicus insignis TaxID=564181 RepID=UPI0022A7C14D|nr:complex I assembly factor TMEM126B, mitochondrial [Peromyscus californicus insignis]